MFSRSSRPEVFCKKDVLKNFAKFTGKHRCQSLFSNKVAGFRPATLLKKGLRHRCFSVNFAKILRTSFLTEYLQWLLPVFKEYEMGTLVRNVLKSPKLTGSSQCSRSFFLTCIRSSPPEVFLKVF